MSLSPEVESVGSLVGQLFVVVVLKLPARIDGCIAIAEMTGAVYSFFIMMIPFDYYFLTTFFPFTIYKPGFAIEATR